MTLHEGSQLDKQTCFTNITVLWKSANSNQRILEGKFIRRCTDGTTELYAESAKSRKPLKMIFFSLVSVASTSLCLSLKDSSQTFWLAVSCKTTPPDSTCNTVRPITARRRDKTQKPDYSVLRTICGPKQENKSNHREVSRGAQHVQHRTGRWWIKLETKNRTLSLYNVASFSCLPIIIATTSG